MPYDSFTDYPLWKEASTLADSVLDFSRGIEDFSLRNRMTGSAVEIPFLVGEAAQSESNEQMRDRLWRVEDPVNELRSVLTESKEQGFAPGADYELMQERCRDLFQKVHREATAIQTSETTRDPEEKGSENDSSAKEIQMRTAPAAAVTRAARMETRPPETTSSVEPVTDEVAESVVDRAEKPDDTLQSAKRKIEAQTRSSGTAPSRPKKEDSDDDEFGPSVVI